MEIVKYVVQKGDTLFGIADKFSLKPETILWGNWVELDGDPHTLQPGQELSILPVDGALHVWSAGESLDGVAKFFRVAPTDILEWPGNNLDLELDVANPGIEEGIALVIPGGQRDAPTWKSPRITRANPASASILGPGACSAVSDGPIGSGSFSWPTSSTWVSGYNYSPGVHPAIDLGGSVGNAIYAADSGVVVYSGWNDWGYGYVIVVDHGNGWQTLYAHLSAVNAGCGQAVFAGQVIGAMGCTGNCSGPHLHFEMMNDSYGKVNPLDFLP
jgi:murein DD-endopeptidase MepM/ murein hydrolase activator NlpD